VGRGRGELQDNGAHQALSRLEPGALQAASSRNTTYRLQPVVVERIVEASVVMMRLS